MLRRRLSDRQFLEIGRPFNFVDVVAHDSVIKRLAVTDIHGCCFLAGNIVNDQIYDWIVGTGLG